MSRKEIIKKIAYDQKVQEAACDICGEIIDAVDNWASVFYDPDTRQTFDFHGACYTELMRTKVPLIKTTYTTWLKAQKQKAEGLRIL